MARFIGEHAGEAMHALGSDGNAVSLVAANKGQRPALPFAERDHYATLAGLVLGKATVNAVGLVVRRPDMTAKESAVNFALAGKRRVCGFGRDGLPDFVGEHECRFVLAVEIAGQLKRADTLRAVDDDARCREQIGEALLAAVEHRAACDAVLLAAVRALEEALRGAPI